MKNLTEFTDIKKIINHIILPGDLPDDASDDDFKYNQKDYRNIKLILYKKDAINNPILYKTDIYENDGSLQSLTIDFTHYDVLANFSNVDTSKAKEVLDTNIRELSKLAYHIDKMIDSRYDKQDERMKKEKELENKMINQVLKKIKDNHNEINHQRITRLH